MGQRVKIRKSGKSKGVAIRRTSLRTPNNTITVGNMTIRGGGRKRRKSGLKARKVAIRRKRA